MKDPIRFIFAGGGTGGHLFSGIAVAQVLKRKYRTAHLLFVGTEYGLEKKIVPKAGFLLRFIQIAPLKGSGFKRKIKNFFQIPGALSQSRKILRDFRPSVVLGIGGYASGPLTLMARLMGIKTAIIEQNAYPGFTNRILGKFVHKVFIASPRAKDFFRTSKVYFTGNPIREEFMHVRPKLHREPFTLFVLGGSQGASSLNLALMASLIYLSSAKDRLKILHQTGEKDLEKVKSIYEKEGFDAEVFSFSQNLISYYERADLVLCRAGAGTITELTCLEKPSILVPYPYAADDHQFYNAMDLVDAGCAEIIYNSDLTGEKIAERIFYFLDHPEELEQRAMAAKKIARPEAADSVLEECLNMLSQQVIEKLQVKS